MDSCQLDETQNGMCWNRAAGFVVVQRPERDSQLFRQEWAAVFAVESQADLAEADRDIVFQGLPIGFGMNLVHQWRHRESWVNNQTGGDRMGRSL
jgi:hypothetical protein